MTISYLASKSRTLLDFEFLKRDVQKQRDLAQLALKQAEDIEQTLRHQPDHSDRMTLEQLRDTFLRLAEELARNANETSNSAITVISSATSAST